MKQASWLFLLLSCWSSSALAWEPFRSESSDVARGNELLKKGQAAGALEAYETAARKLPNDPGVQLNRGLALMAQGKLAPAREAFRNAAGGDAPADVRADALYNMGLAFMNEADQAQKGDDLEGAQKLLRESVDAFKSSLRAKPRNRDAAWNLELAKRRLVEVEKKQAEKKQQEEQEKKNDESNQDDEQKQNDSGEQGDADKQDQPENQKGDQQQPKPDQSDQQDASDKKDDGAGEQKNDDAQEGKDASQDPKPEPKQNEAEKQPNPSQPQQDTAEAAPEQRMPEHMRKALDALSAGEENLEKQRALMRARQRPRRIEKDW